MYDTIEMRIPKAEQNYTIDTLSAVLYNYKVKTDEETQQREIKGYLLGCNNCDVEVYANNKILCLGKRSIAKWIFGNNLIQPTRKDIERAFADMSNILQVSIEDAIISRFDIGVNLSLSKDVAQYIQRLGTLRGKSPIRNENSLLYPCTGGKLVIYDKMAEMHQKREYIPTLWEGCNVLRCEQRYITPKKYFKREIRARELTDHVFYYNRIQSLKNEARNIIKQEKEMDMSSIFGNGVKGLQRVSAIALIERLGGLDKTLNAIDEAYKGKPNKKKEKSDVKNYIISSYSGCGLIAKDDEVTKELIEQIEQINIFAE